jgi:hypothetical protein
LLLNLCVNDSPRHFLIGLAGVIDGSLGALEEPNDTLHHTNSLVQGTVVVVTRESVLLQEVFSDYLGYLQNGLLVFGQRVLSDQLNDFSQVFFFLKDFSELCLQPNELRVVLTVILF